MFKDFSKCADQKETKNSVPHQAHLHGELVNYLLHLDSFLKLVDLKEMYALHQAHAKKIFNENLIVTRTSSELNALVNMRDDNYSRSYRARGYDTHENNLTLTYERKDILFDTHHSNQRIINNLLVEICKKETYIEHKQSDNTASLANDKIKDAVIDMNSWLQRGLHGTDLYNLRYRAKTEDETDKDVGFVKQVKKVEPLRIDPEIVIDTHWCNTVFDTKRTILEYQGARTFTLALTPVSSNSRMKMFRTTQLQIRGTREQVYTARSYFNHGQWKNIGPLFKTHELFFCVSQGVGKEYWALGSDEKKAESVMRRRQKLEMLRTLNL